MKRIIFYQTHYNTVKYITDDMSEETSLPYLKFHQWIFSYKIIDSDKMNERLNCFNTIYLDMETLTWEVILPEKKQVDFETLVKFNPDPEETKKIEQDNRLEVKGKKYLDSVTEWKRQNDRFNRYR